MFVFAWPSPPHLASHNCGEGRIGCCDFWLTTCPSSKLFLFHTVPYLLAVGFLHFWIWTDFRSSPDISSSPIFISHWLWREGGSDLLNLGMLLTCRKDCFTCGDLVRATWSHCFTSYPTKDGIFRAMEGGREPETNMPTAFVRWPESNLKSHNCDRTFDNSWFDPKLFCPSPPHSTLILCATVHSTGSTLLQLLRLSADVRWRTEVRAFLHLNYMQTDIFLHRTLYLTYRRRHHEDGGGRDRKC